MIPLIYSLKYETSCRAVSTISSILACAIPVAVRDRRGDRRGTWPPSSVAFFSASRLAEAGYIVQSLVLHQIDIMSSPVMAEAAAGKVEAAAQEKQEKPKKKICCACPTTKKLRDECIVEHGEEACTKWIEAHKQCLRSEGFNV
ncbi:unnamed protein product [Closterium sp. Naga37s-1]|nr:unnamed protein product [Closterium sp. Naga37s-1]